MQESLEDYINFTKNKKPDKIKISNEMIVTAQLKKECDARAMKIVEFSIDGKLRSEVFIKSLHYITPGQYQDIIDERALTQLCGYPICGNSIPDMPKKQYYISMKSNKIYDITERKNFCSNYCYKASLHIKKQISTSPLWLRQQEEIPKFNLLPTSKGGLPGEYIDHGIAKPPIDIEPKFTSISSFAEASLGNIEEMEKTTCAERDKSEKTPQQQPSSAAAAATATANVDIKTTRKSSSKLKSTMQTITENVVEEDVKIGPVIKTNNNHKNCILKKDHNQKKNCVCNLPAIKEQEIDEKLNNLELTATINKIMQSKRNRTPILIEPLHYIRDNKKAIQTINQQQSVCKTIDINLEKLLTNTINSWLTLETCIYLHGEKKIRETLDEDELNSYFNDLNIEHMHMDNQKKYMEICKRLKLQEIAEDNFNKATTSGNCKLKPLPDFKKLKEDVKDMNLKVKCFFSGSEYPLDRPKGNDDDKENEINRKNDKEDTMPQVMPQTDHNSKMLMRRNALTTSVNRVLPQILLDLEIKYLTPILSDMQELVRTFHLTPDNVTFKSKVWKYIGVILLYLLSLKNDKLQQILSKERSKHYINILMSSVPNQIKFLENLLEKINDIRTFTKQYISKS